MAEGEELEVKEASVEARLIAYLKKDILQDEDATLEIDTPLVSSGLIDSFSLVEVLTHLERLLGVRLPAGRISPQDLETVASMLKVASRHGEPTGASSDP